MKHAETPPHQPHLTQLTYIFPHEICTQEVGTPRDRRFETMKKQMFHHGPNEPASLKGRAAELHYFCHPLLKVWVRHMDAGNTQHVQIKLALENNVEMENQLTLTHGMYKLPEAEAKKFEEAAINFVALCAQLREFYGQVKLFAFTIKMHYLIYLRKRNYWEVKTGLGSDVRRAT